MLLKRLFIKLISEAFKLFGKLSNKLNSREIENEIFNGLLSLIIIYLNILKIILSKRLFIKLISEAIKLFEKRSRKLYSREVENGIFLMKLVHYDSIT